MKHSRSQMPNSRLLVRQTEARSAAVTELSAPTGAESACYHRPPLPGIRKHAARSPAPAAQNGRYARETPHCPAPAPSRTRTRRNARSLTGPTDSAILSLVGSTPVLRGLRRGPERGINSRMGGHLKDSGKKRGKIAREPAAVDDHEIPAGGVLAIT